MRQLALGSRTLPSIPGAICAMRQWDWVSILLLALPSCSVTLGELEVKTLLGFGDHVRLELRNIYHIACVQWVQGVALLLPLGACVVYRECGGPCVALGRGQHGHRED